MHIGLIGGIGPAATDFYYQKLIGAFILHKAELDLTMAHASTATLLENLANDNKAAQTAIYDRLARRLQAAGADCVVVTSIAGHFCIDMFKEVSVLPVIDMVAAVETAMSQIGLEKIGILGTRTVMESRFYGGISSVELVPPAGADLADVHDAYVTMAAAGTVTDVQRTIFDRAAKNLMNDQEAQAIMLGGTDLALVYDRATAPFKIVDCAQIHVDAVVATAFDGVAEPADILANMDLSA